MEPSRSAAVLPPLPKPFVHATMVLLNAHLFGLTVAVRPSALLAARKQFCSSTASGPTTVPMSIPPATPGVRLRPDVADPGWRRRSFSRGSKIGHDMCSHG